MTTTTQIVGTVKRGSYVASHIDAATRIAGRDPHRPRMGQTIRLEGTRMIVVVAGVPTITADTRHPGQYEWLIDVAEATPFQAAIHQQIEVIEDSLRVAAGERRRAA